MSSAARRRAWAPPSRRLPVVALAAVLALPLTPVAAAGLPAAEAGDDEPGLRIVLDSVSPIVLRPGRPATLNGRVINSSPTAARLSGVTLTASTSLLGTRREIADWVDGDVDRSTPWVLGDDTVGPLVPAQGEVDFSFTVTGTALGSLPDGPAALAVRINAEAEGDGATSEPGQGGSGGVAELRAVLTSSGGDDVAVPLETSWVVPLTLPPDPDLVNPDPTAHAEAWTAAVGPGSDVRGWMDHLRLPDVTWLVDPALLVAPRPAPSVAAAPPEEPEGTDGDDQGGEGRTQIEPAPVPAPASPTTDSTTVDPTDGSPATEEPDDEASTSSPAGPAAEDEASSDADLPGVGTLGEARPDELEVAQVLAELRERLAEASDDLVWWLPTGDPDLARLADEDLAPQPDRVAELLGRRLPDTEVPAAVVRLLRTGRHHVLWPALAGPTTEDLTNILDLYPPGGVAVADVPSRTDVVEPEVVLVPRESFTASTAAPPRRGAVPVTDTDVVALGADSWTTALVVGSTAEAQQRGAAAASQHLLAHTLGTWLESPTTRRELVVIPPRGTAPDTEVLDQLARGWSDAGWLETVPAEELLERAEEGESVVLSGTPPQEAVLGERAAVLVPADSPVDASRGRQLVELADDLQGLSEILVDSEALHSWWPALAGLWSTRWRQDPEAWPVTWRVLRTDVKQTRAAVHIAATNVNFIADEGTVHITVVNDLPVAVDDVQLAVTADNGRLQVLTQPEPVSIGPGSRASVPFDARAITRGEVTLTVELTTPGGTDLGVDEQITVRVQPTGVWIYWVLGGLASVILVLGLARALPGPPRVARGAGGDGSAYPDAGPTTASGEEARQ